jgi:hypothetical protein
VSKVIAGKPLALSSVSVILLPGAPTYPCVERKVTENTQPKMGLHLGIIRKLSVKSDKYP